MNSCWRPAELARFLTPITDFPMLSDSLRKCAASVRSPTTTSEDEILRDPPSFPSHHSLLTRRATSVCSRPEMIPPFTTTPGQFFSEVRSYRDLIRAAIPCPQSTMSLRGGVYEGETHIVCREKRCKRSSITYHSNQKDAEHPRDTCEALFHRFVMVLRLVECKKRASVK